MKKMFKTILINDDQLVNKTKGQKLCEKIFLALFIFCWLLFFFQYLCILSEALLDGWYFFKRYVSCLMTNRPTLVDALLCDSYNIYNVFDSVSTVAVWLAGCGFASRPLSIRPLYVLYNQQMNLFWESSAI